ncbi:hypothetical protein EMIT043CA1_190078 [Pseudomonas brassicacearum]
MGELQIRERQDCRYREQARSHIRFASNADL